MKEQPKHAQSRRSRRRKRTARYIYRYATVGILAFAAVIVAIAARNSTPEAPRSTVTTPTAVSINKVQGAPSPNRDQASPVTPAPTPTPPPVPEKTSEPTPFVKRSAVIHSLGDFVMHDALNRSAYSEADKSFDYTPMFEMVRHILEGSDYTVANVEGSLGGRGKEGYLTYPRFNTPPELVGNLVECGVDMLTLSNNHALDMYFDGFKKTIETCESYGMAFVGGARTQAEHDTPVIKDINGIQVGFLNYTSHTNGMEQYVSDDARRIAIYYIKYADFNSDVRALREAGAEFVIAYLHWGNEYERKENSTQRSTARKLAAAGADVIVGSHPHVTQPIAWVEAKNGKGETKRTLCAYSLGNFISNQPERHRDTGIIFKFTIQETAPGEFEVTDPAYIPTYYWRRGSEKTGIVARIVSVGEWLEAPPEGMNETSYKRLKQIWSETKKLIGDKAALVSAN